MSLKPRSPHIWHNKELMLASLYNACYRVQYDNLPLPIDNGGSVRGIIIGLLNRVKV